MQSGKGHCAASESVEDAGPSVDNGDEEQEGQHGELPGTSLGLEMIVASCLSFSYLISPGFRAFWHSISMSVCM